VGFPLKHIDGFDHAQLLAMNSAAHYSARAQPEGIMSLKELLDACRKRCRLLLEIKNRDWEPASRHEMKVRQSLQP
jgi:glycerophosphoryl diester phosphodiesterase